MTMIPDGPRYQAGLGGRPQETPHWILEAFRGVGCQQVTVKEVDYVGSRVQVYNSNGLRWAYVLKTKTSGTTAGEINMPNVGDIGLVVGSNGDQVSSVWLGALDDIETRNTLGKDSNFVNAASLIHRAYWKHETGSFRLLDKVGNFVATLFRRPPTPGMPPTPATEATPAVKNANITVGNNGTISISTFKSDGATLNLTVNMTADGSLAVENDGHQIAMIATPGSEIFRYRHKKKDVTMQVTQNGDVSLEVSGSVFAMEQTSGDVSLNHKSGTYVAVEQDAVEVGTQDGSTVLLGKDQAQIALSTGQSVVLDNSGDTVEITAGNANVDADNVQLSSGITQQPLLMTGFYVKWNAVRELLATHVHAALNAPSVTLAVLAVPDVPVAGVDATAQVTGA
jgi:hypothetical protein